MRITKTGIRFLLKIVISGGLLAFLLSKISLDDLFTLIHTLNPSIIALAVLVFFASNLMGSLQWCVLLNSSGVGLRFPRAFKFYFVGLFFNNFLPANIGGDAVKVYDVTKVGSSVYQVIAVTLLDRLIGIFSLCLLACISVLSLIASSPVDTLWLYLLIFLGCMTPVLGFYFFEPLGRVVRRVVGSIRPLSLHLKGASILDYLGEFKARKILILRLIGLSIVIQTLRVMTHVLVAIALGMHIDVLVLTLFFIFVPLLSLAMIPPVTINGLGVREGLGILLFAQAGFGRTDAFTLEFLTYLVSVSVSLLGFIFFVSRRESRREPTDITAAS